MFMRICTAGAAGVALLHGLAVAHLRIELDARLGLKHRDLRALLQGALAHSETASQLRGGR